MIEADIWRSLISVLRSGLDSNGLSSIEIHQANQPLKQGPSSNDSVYLHKITSQRVGHQGRKHEYDEENENFIITEKYWLSVTIQLMALVSQDIGDEDSLTAFDVTERCAAIMQTLNTRKLLLNDKISIERIGQIPVSFSVDDKDQFDLDPTFDMVLLYEQTLVYTVPKLSDIDGGMIAVSQIPIFPPVIPTFSFEVKTTTPNETFIIPFELAGTYDCIVSDDTGTDNITVWNQAEATRTYPNAGTHIVNITGVVIGFKFNDGPNVTKVYDLKSFGPVRPLSGSGFLDSFTNLTISATDILDLTGVTSAANFFTNTKITTIPSINQWDTVLITNWFRAFRNNPFFNQFLSFPTQSVTTMGGMLQNNILFDQSLGGLNIGSVTGVGLSGFLNGVTMSTANGDATIIGWQGQPHQPNVTCSLGNTKLTGGGAAEAAHDALVADGWGILFGGFV